MREPSLRTSRLTIAGALVAAVALGGGGFYLGRTTSPKPEPLETPVVETPAAEPSVIPEIERMLDQAGLIQIANSASEALVAGREMSVSVRDAAGRRFELAIPFGCSGPASEDSQAPLRWRYDREDGTLRLHAAVMDWSAADWHLGDAEGVEAIEGFWIARPWSSSNECPERAAGESATGSEPAVNAERSLAVAQFFRDGVRREALRDGRPFESVQSVPAEEFAAPRGFRLMLAGRVDRVPQANGQGSPVRCIQPGGIEQRPVCVLAVTLDEVRIENPVSGEILASWAIGRD